MSSKADSVNPHARALLVVSASFLVVGLMLGISARTAAPLLLMQVVVVALWSGPKLTLLVAAGATLTYWGFFMPPLGFSLPASGDWLTLGTFASTAVLIGELAALVERRRSEAQAKQRELESLYHQLQEAFEQATEAESQRRSAQLKATLLDALTHNLRTPLTAIKASVTALLEPDNAGGPAILAGDDRVELLKVIDEESDRLNRYIGGLSPNSERHVSPPHGLEPVSVDHIFRAGLTRAEALTRDHHVRISIDRAVPALAVDAAALAEVVHILLDNATKYSPAGTEVHLRADREDAQTVRITVMDEGPGIPQGLRERVFERFFRVEAHDPPGLRAGGAGLGLSIARQLVEVHGGWIDVETPPSGHGTAVSVRLPVGQDPDEPHTLVPPGPGEFRQSTGQAP